MHALAIFALSHSSQTRPGLLLKFVLVNYRIKQKQLSRTSLQLLSVKATAVLFSAPWLSFFSVCCTITHEPLHFPWWVVAWTCRSTSTTSRTVLKFQLYKSKLRVKCFAFLCAWYCSCRWAFLWTESAEPYGYTRSCILVWPHQVNDQVNNYPRTVFLLEQGSTVLSLLLLLFHRDVTFYR